MTSLFLETALGYAQASIAVFPVHGVTNGACTCGNTDCSSAGKHPLTRNGFKAATTDLSTIEAWWSQFPRANIGAPTGHINGFVVVDIDPRHGGTESYQRLARILGPHPSTAESITGGGGRHIYFKCPIETVRNKAPIPGYEGVDFRGDGGYVLLPPSAHISGGTYKWDVLLLEVKGE